MAAYKSFNDTSIYGNTPVGYIDFSTFRDIIQNKRSNPTLYSNLITTIKPLIHNRVIKDLDDSDIHLVKSEYPTINRMVKMYGNIFGSSINFVEEFSQQITYAVKKECGEDQVVVFWDFLKDIEIYNNPTSERYYNDMFIAIECSYNIIDKKHQSITPPKNMVKMLISNENYEKSNLH